MGRRWLRLMDMGCAIEGVRLRQVGCMRASGRRLAHRLVLVHHFMGALLGHNRLGGKVKRGIEV